jgi:hypothetical protein
MSGNPSKPMTVEPYAHAAVAHIDAIARTIANESMRNRMV